jgi:tRNA modification GTPase
VTQATIIAPASGAVPAGVCVVRASGPQASGLIKALAGRLPPARRASLCTVRKAGGEAIDRALVLWFPAPASFTGEDCAEFHLHGGKAVLEAFLAAALQVGGVRLAGPGEFTRRAYEHGRMDLSAAEGLADLIEAETEAQRRQALGQMDGRLGRVTEGWREAVISALADAEADIDFPDEDLPPGLAARTRSGIRSLLIDLERHLASASAAQAVRDGLSVAILGAPNAGKSSLLNALVGREAAIVSGIPGTTRDVVEVRMVLGGAVVWLADTAGLRDSADHIESEGIRRALARAESADVRIGVANDEADLLAIVEHLRSGDVLVQSKADLAVNVDLVAPLGVTVCAVSAVTGFGLQDLLGLLTNRAQAALSHSVEAPLTRLRHTEAVREAISALRRAMAVDGYSVELAAEDLRLAARALGRIAGRVDVDEVLDRLFAQFCIGK